MEEIWKDINGYEGLYQISNKGNVKSLNYRRTGKEHNLQQFRNIHGILTVTLVCKGRKKQISVLSLLAEHFPKIEYKNKLYKSKADLARTYNLMPDQLHSRLHSNWTLEEALEIPIRREKRILNVKLYEYKGKFFSIEELVKISRKRRNCLERRMKRGWSVDEAVEIPLGKGGKYI